MIGPDSRHWENIHHCVIVSSLFHSVRQAGWLINVNLPYKREHPTLFRICNHSASSLFLSCTVYGHDASFFHFNPFLCCSLEQKMSPGTNVSSSKTTERNILIVFYFSPCFWWLEKIVDNERVRRSPAGCYLIAVVLESPVVVDSQSKDTAVLMIRVKQSPCCSAIIVVSFKLFEI